MSVDITHFDLHLAPDPSRVVIRSFHVAGAGSDLQSRARRIFTSVLAMSPEECAAELEAVDADFEGRHWQTEAIYERRYQQVMQELGLKDGATRHQRALIGAYFCHEYSYAAAAVMNPSVVPHPDQSGLSNSGDQRVIVSLRAVGEGHISSIVFREGILTTRNQFTLWPQPKISVAVDSSATGPEGEVVAHRSASSPISGTVIFPLTAAQRNGLEDLRLVRFTEDDGRVTNYGTYTAYSGAAITSELLETPDFTRFTLSPMSGSAVNSKGMALFPRRCGGDYVVIGRQDGESVFLMRSDSPKKWNGGEKLLTPKFPWELVQMGNCGSPIELDEGWLLLTHGVGAMRKYAIGAALLDKKDPGKVLARLTQPLLAPSDENRAGYVPNVLYTCGGLRHGDKLFLPYGVADSSVAFALVDLPSLLSAMR